MKKRHLASLFLWNEVLSCLIFSWAILSSFDVNRYSDYQSMNDWYIHIELGLWRHKIQNIRRNIVNNKIVFLVYRMICFVTYGAKIIFGFPSSITLSSPRSLLRLTVLSFLLNVLFFLYGELVDDIFFLIGDLGLDRARCLKPLLLLLVLLLVLVVSLVLSLVSLLLKGVLWVWIIEIKIKTHNQAYERHLASPSFITPYHSKTRYVR